MNRKHSRSEILAQGESIMRAQGYHNTGIRDILRSCGIPKGSFYNYFNGKEGFTLEVIEYYGKMTSDFIERNLDPNSELRPIERLRKHYEMLIQIAESEDCKKGCLVYNMSLETGGLSDTLAEALKAQIDKWIAMVQICVEEGQDEGGIRKDLSAKEIAELLQSSFNGAFAHLKVARNSSLAKNTLNASLKLITPNSHNE